MQNEFLHGLNSLLKLPSGSLDNSQPEPEDQLSMFENQDHIAQLKAVKEEYFGAEFGRRTELKSEFWNIQKQMFQDTIYRLKKDASARYEALFNWAPFDNEITPWFDPDWMFGIKDGFDIVIANPPYIDSEIMTRAMPELRKKYATQYTVAKGNWDIFLLFIERGIRLVSSNGICTMIVPNKLVAANYAAETRKFISNYYLMSIRDYSDVNVFDDVAVYPVVFLISRSQPTDARTECVVMKSISSIENASLVDWSVMRRENNWDRFFNASPIQNSIINKIQVGKKLQNDLIAKVRGAATVNEAYKIKEMLSENPNPESYEKRFINTGTIDRYSTSWASGKTQYIKGSYYCPVVNIEEISKNYPKRAYEANAAKIIIAGMTKRLECYYDEGMCMAGKSTIIIYDSMISLKYLCAVLNSKLMSWYYGVYFNSLSLAGGFYRMGAPQIKELPFVIPDDMSIKKIEGLVDSQLAHFDEEIDSEIDYLVYSIYGLSDEEISFIEASSKT